MFEGLMDSAPTAQDYDTLGVGLPTFDFVGDAADTAKLASVQPGETGLSWWENMLKYGVTRAIDSHYNNQDAMRLQQSSALGVQGANGQTVKPGVTGLLPNTNAGWQQLAVYGIIGVVAWKLVT